MQAVWKYPLQQVGQQEIIMPAGAEVLAVQMQGNTLTLWAKVSIPEPHDPPLYQKVHILGTGHEKEKIKGRYIGTVQQMSGDLIWHVFIEN